MLKTWRLIPPIEASGFIHMAVDEWLLEQHRQHNGLPCLRFYTWKPVAISLGYHQRHYPNHWNYLEWQGHPLDLVRRPTGGRAVLHQGDLTYSLVVSGYSGRRRDIYSHLCQFLIEGWQRLGVSLYLGADKHSYQRSTDCFSTVTAADLVIDTGYKVIGSAQLYRDDCILQHGSIRLTPNSDLVEKVFGTAITPPSGFKFQSTTVAEALTSAAQDVFQVEFETVELSQAELEQAAVLTSPHPAT